MIDIEVDEVLAQAKIGFWNLKMALIGLCGCMISAGAYVFPALAYGEMRYTCDVQNSSYVVDKDQCSYTFQNITSKCLHFKYSPGTFHSTFVSRFDLVCDRKVFIDYNLQILMLSQMFSTCFCNIIMDKIGRKTMYVISTGMCAMCSVMYLVAPRVEYALVVRLVECIFLMSAYVSGFVLITESLPPKYRIVGTSNAEHFYGIGISYAAIISLIYSDWKFFIYTRLLIPSACLCIVAVLFIDESPKWLLQRRQYTNMSRVITRIFNQNRTKMPPSISDRLVNLNSTDCEDEKNRFTIKHLIQDIPFWQLFQTRRTALWMIILSMNWITCVIVYYGLLFSQELFNVKIQYFFLISGLSTMPACLMQYVIANKFGRRFAIIVSFFLTGICLVAGAFTPNHGMWVIMRYIVACSSFLFITAAFLTIYMWHSELMPTNLRAIGIGIGSLSGRFCGIFLTPVLTYLSDINQKLPIYILAAIVLCAAICSMFVPETRNQSLPDNIEEYECYGTEKYTSLKEKRSILINDLNQISI